MEFFNSDFFSLFSDTQRSQLLSQGSWGLEREALRISPDGELALSPHPAVFGDKQTNPRITTDFSESQIELITSPCQSIKELYRELESIHREVRDGLANEDLWPLSMPGRLPDEWTIPIARYASEKEHETYRKGLALRYGKKMQMISGIHYNYSFSPELLRFLYKLYQNERYTGSEKNRDIRDYPDFVDALYFSVVRNFLRYRWLLLYLFGASPAFDDSYEHEMLCGIGAVKTRHATSLRMSRLGYYNSLQDNFSVSYNSKSEYIRDLKKILSTRSEQYAKLGLRKNGEMLQLNDFVLQKESEFYSPIRFKQSSLENESLLEALDKRGVDYLEMRVLDLDPFSPNGVDLNTLYFTHTLMVYSLLAKSPAIDRQEMEELDNNHHLVAMTGRKKGLNLSRNGTRCKLSVWAREILYDLMDVAALLDRNEGSGEHAHSVRVQMQKLNNPALLPSAIIEKEMQSAAHDMTSYGLVKAGKFYNEMRDVGSKKGVELNIKTPNLERLSFLADSLVNDKSVINNLPAQFS